MILAAIDDVTERSSALPVPISDGNRGALQWRRRRAPQFAYESADEVNQTLDSGRAIKILMQRVRKGALPAGRYTGRARRTKILIVGGQDSGGETGSVTI